MIKLKQLVKSILLESRVMLSKYEDILKSKYNIDYSDLSFLGRGDFGEAYSHGNKVYKFTTSKNESKLANEILKNNSKIYEAFADIYDVLDLGDGITLIVQEELEADSNIENLYYELQNYLDEQGLPIQYLHRLDTDEIEITDELERFMDDLYDIIRAYNNLGVEASDIRPDNMGYSKEGKLKAFDIDDKRR